MDSEEEVVVTVEDVGASRAEEEVAIVDSREAVEGEVDEVDSSEVETLVLRIPFSVSRGYWLGGDDLLNPSRYQRWDPSSTPSNPKCSARQ